MSIRTLMTVALALVFGLSAAVGVNMVVNGNRAKAAPVVTAPVVTAAVAIPRGGMVTDELIKVTQYPKDSVPTGALTSLEDALNRAVLIPMLPGEPLLDGKLAPKGAGRGMAALIPKGMRAFTIQTPNVASGVAGFIMPGNKVDVLMTVTDSGQNDRTGGGSTTRLLQNVEILAVDQMIDAPAENKMDATQLRSVTLLVTPEQDGKLNLGQNKGMLHLSLRSPEDDQDADTRPVLMSDLRYSREKPWDERAKGVMEALGKALAQRQPARANAPEPAKAPEPRPLKIRTLRGRNEGTVLIRQPGTTSNGL